MGTKVNGSHATEAYIEEVKWDSVCASALEAVECY